MAFPTEPTEPIVEIATDADYSVPGEDWDGQPTKVAPTTAIEEQGYVPGTPRPADVDNWLLNMIAKWLGYFKDFADELLNVRIVSDEWTYPTAKTRYARFVGTLLVGRTGAVSNTTNDSGVPGRLALETDSGYYTLAFELPAGCTIEALRVLWTPGAARAGANRMQASLFRRPVTVPLTLAGFGSTTQIATMDDNGAVVLGMREDTSVSQAVSAGDVYYVTIQAGNTASGANDTVTLIEVEYTSPGPR